MKRVKRIFFRMLLWTAAGLLMIVLVLVGQEVVTFTTRTELGAQYSAKQDFLRECARRGLNPSEFTGPQRIKSPEGTYGFVWANPSNGDQIATMVRYLPAGVESWLIGGKENGKFEPYCDERAAVCR